jgi:hypothetical protein
MKQGDEDMNGIWEMKKFVRDEGIKGITLPERLTLRLRCSVMAKIRDIVTEIRDKHLYDGIMSTNT